MNPSIFTILSWAIFLCSVILFAFTGQKELATYLIFVSISFNTLPKS